MSTEAIVIIVAAVVILALLVFILPRSRGKGREQRITRQRDEVASAHRAKADQGLARADHAERQAALERAEADLHESRAKLHERGLADDELATEREHMNTTNAGQGPRIGREGFGASVAPDNRWAR